MSKKHILVVSQYFYPEPFRINDMCLEWVKRGYKVTVLTGIPNYPEGKFYPGYSWSKRRKETWNGVEIIRIPLFARGKGSVRLALNYASFVVSGFFWKLFTKIKADLVFSFEVSPMTQVLVGCWYAKRRKVPHYLYVQDLWPENVEIVTGIHSKAILGPIGKMVNRIYKKTDFIFATSESFVTEIQKRVFENPEKVKFWPQYAEEFYVPTEQRIPELTAEGAFKIVFTGNIGQAQGLGILPRAAQILKEKGVLAKFVVVGDGREKEALLREIEDRDVSDRFLMIDRRPAEEIPAYLCSCQAAFVSFMDNPLFANTIPAKLQSYMACGMPIIAAATGETQRIVEDAQCGVCCKIGDAEDLASTVTLFMARTDIEALGRNARAYSEAHFDKTCLMDEMDEYITKPF
jgi:glycosyltransferase involved in cell wall biosynthesis